CRPQIHLVRSERRIIAKTCNGLFGKAERRAAAAITAPARAGLCHSAIVCAKSGRACAAWRAEEAGALSAASTSNVCAPAPHVILSERPSSLSNPAVWPGSSTRRTRVGVVGSGSSETLFSLIISVTAQAADSRTKYPLIDFEPKTWLMLWIGAY